jgi:hypothetical protein
LAGVSISVKVTSARLMLAWSWAVVLGAVALAWAVLAAFGWGYSQSFIDDGGCYPGSPVFAWGQAGIAAAGIVAILLAAVVTVRFAKSKSRGSAAVMANLAVLALAGGWLIVVATHESPPSLSWISDEAECAAVSGGR